MQEFCKRLGEAGDPLALAIDLGQVAPAATASAPLRTDRLVTIIPSLPLAG